MDEYTLSAVEHPVSLTLNQDQRDALLYESDDAVQLDCLPTWYVPVVRETSSRLINDLVLPDGAGNYHVKSVEREPLIAFLEHALLVAQQTAAGLRIWHTCLTLLERLGYELEGSIYDGIDCRCPNCAWTRRCRAEAEEELMSASDEDEQRTILDRVGREIDAGPYAA